MSEPKQVKIVLLTGYLGAGKTTIFTCFGSDIVSSFKCQTFISKNKLLVCKSGP